MTHFGIKKYLNTHNKMDEGNNREFQPFAEINWIHNTSDFSVSMNGVSSCVNGAKNIDEVKVGIEGQINRNVNLGGDISNQIGGMDTETAPPCQVLNITSK